MPDKIKTLIEKMSLNEKIGQLFTFGFSGVLPTPEARTMIEDLQCGGLRITPNVLVFKKNYSRVSIDESGKTIKQDILPPASPHTPPYVLRDTIDSFQQMAVGRRSGVPLHISIDMEGGSSGDITRGGYPFFPAPMGLAQSNDPNVYYEVGAAQARLAVATGVNMIHSPVLDVVDHPHSPEINIRSYGGDPREVAERAGETMRAFTDYGLIATGKHFPGRGYSDKDVHYEEDACPLDLAAMKKGELLPYIELIKKGLPAIMLAHSSYPALCGEDLPATISPKLVKGILREELGFNGVITTDSITMHGILDICPVDEACARAIQAGVDLILYKTSFVNDAKRSITTVTQWVENGKIPMSQIDESVGRVLRMKENAGATISEKPSPKEDLEKLLSDNTLRALEKKTSREAIQVPKQEKDVLPVQGDKKVLVVEQCMFLAEQCNDQYFHPYQFWNLLRPRLLNPGLVRIATFGTDEDLEKVKDAAIDFDLIIATNIYSRGSMPNTEFVEKVIAETGKETIVVTNSPYPVAVTDSMKTVIVTFSEGPESLRAVVEKIFF